MKKTGKTRFLTASEIDMARKIFGSTIDYDKVQIANRRVLPLFQPKNGGMCTGNTINITGSAYCDEYTDRLQSFFIHEMTHIWQYQQSPLTFGKKHLNELRKHHFNYMSKAYTYEIIKGKNFSAYGLEQQAAMVQDYFALTHNKGVGQSANCANKDLSGEDKRMALETILKPHFPLTGSAPAPKRSTPKI